MAKNIINYAQSYLGVGQGSARHKELINRYNRVKPLPGGYKLKDSDNWYASFISVMGDCQRIQSLLDVSAVSNALSIFLKRKVFRVDDQSLFQGT